MLAKKSPKTECGKTSGSMRATQALQEKYRKILAKTFFENGMQEKYKKNDKRLM